MNFLLIAKLQSAMQVPINEYGEIVREIAKLKKVHMQELVTGGVPTKLNNFIDRLQPYELQNEVYTTNSGMRVIDPLIAQAVDTPFLIDAWKKHYPRLVFWDGNEQQRFQAVIDFVYNPGEPVKMNANIEQDWSIAYQISILLEIYNRVILHFKTESFLPVQFLAEPVVYARNNKNMLNIPTINMFPTLDQLVSQAQTRELRRKQKREEYLQKRSLTIRENFPKRYNTESFQKNRKKKKKLNKKQRLENRLKKQQFTVNLQDEDKKEIIDTWKIDDDSKIDESSSDGDSDF